MLKSFMSKVKNRISRLELMGHWINLSLSKFIRKLEEEEGLTKGTMKVQKLNKNIRKRLCSAVIWEKKQNVSQ